MKPINSQLNCVLFLLGFVFIIGCKIQNQQNIEQLEIRPKTEPDYSEVTIPSNLAPINFFIKEEGNSFKITVSSETSGKNQISIHSKDGIVMFPEKQWSNFIAENCGEKIKIQVTSFSKKNKTAKEFIPFYINIANDPIDKYLTYRLIQPGYYSWSDIKIVQRSLENFKKETVVDNKVIDKNCVNCHSFNQNNPNEFLIHIRGSNGGTYFIEDETITQTNLKIENMPGGATYPTWHPNGRFIAFSSNQVRQNFYAHRSKSIEVYDLISTLILYDKEKNKITTITSQDSTIPLETFPSWSPDGKYLYYCSANNKNTTTSRDIEDIKNIHYDLVRKPFNNETRLFGDAEIIFNASEINKSVSFPRISPNGKLLVFTLQDYGTFPVWHNESDLHIINLESGESKKMNINSEKAESYHSWSKNSKWLVFSSKRFDGRSSFPYFAYVNSFTEQGKPFILPQKNPEKYSQMLESFNIPELISDRITVKPQNFSSAIKQKAIQSKQGISENENYKWNFSTTNNQNNNEKGIHE